MKKRESLIGKTFGRLFVESFIEVGSNYRSIYMCLCSCGKRIKACNLHLKSGHTKSCGCFKRDRMRQTKSKGYSVNGKTTIEYTMWLSAKQRAKKVGKPFSIVPEDINGSRILPSIYKCKTF